MGGGEEREFVVSNPDGTVFRGCARWPPASYAPIPRVTALEWDVRQQAARVVRPAHAQPQPLALERAPPGHGERRASRASTASTPASADALNNNVRSRAARALASIRGSVSQQRRSITITRSHEYGPGVCNDNYFAHAGDTNNNAADDSEYVLTVHGWKLRGSVSTPVQAVPTSGHRRALSAASSVALTDISSASTLRAPPAPLTGVMAVSMTRPLGFPRHAGVIVGNNGICSSTCLARPLVVQNRPRCAVHAAHLK